MIPDGAFVWTNFPFGHPPEARSRPGPFPHVAYCIGSDQSVILLAYTSSGPWRGSALGRPPGVVEFDAEQAARLNQRAFHIDLRVLAKVAPTRAWFPYWDREDRGVVALAPPGVRRCIIDAAKALVAVSKESVETRGIGSPTLTTTRRTRRV